MKKLISVLLLLFFIMPIPATGVNLSISASCAVVMVVQTGEVLYAHNAYERRSMASTTKIMTSLLAIENGDMNKVYKVGGDELKVEGTSMGLLDGDYVSLKALVHGMLLQSGNDAANVTAYRIGGSPEKFAEMMNKRAKEIGMTRTNFVTPSGLDDENHYTCAYDMALLGCEAIRNVVFKSISSKQTAKVSYGDPPYQRTMTNHNKMLKNYDGCVGLKTGFTKKSGRCLVCAAERNGVTLVSVTLKAPNDWDDTRKLLDYGFSCVEKRDLSCETDNKFVKVVGGKVGKVGLYCDEPLFLPVNESMSGVSCDYLLDKFAYAPVKKGDVLGKAVYKLNGKVIKEVQLKAKNDIKIKIVEKKTGFLEKIRNWFIKIFKGE